MCGVVVPLVPPHPRTSRTPCRVTTVSASAGKGPGRAPGVDSTTPPDTLPLPPTVKTPYSTLFYVFYVFYVLYVLARHCTLLLLYLSAATEIGWQGTGTVVLFLTARGLRMISRA